MSRDLPLTSVVLGNPGNNSGEPYCWWRTHCYSGSRKLQESVRPSWKLPELSTNEAYSYRRCKGFLKWFHGIKWNIYDMPPLFIIISLLF